MATEAQIAANRRNAESSTGPRTKEGKSRSSRNAVTFGIYSAADFVLPEDNRLYHLFCENFQKELSPRRPVRTNAGRRDRPRRLASSPLFRHRIQHGRIQHASPATTSSIPWLSPPSPAPRNPSTAPAPNPIATCTAPPPNCAACRPNASSASNACPRTSIPTAFGGLTSLKDLEPILALDLRRKLLIHKLEGTDTLAAIIQATNPPVSPAPAPEPPTTKRTQSDPPEPTQIPRSQPCPCGSGVKYKRCCGKNAPGVFTLKQAA